MTTIDQSIMRTDLLFEPVTCSVCKTTDMRTVLTAESPACGFGPYVWIRLPKGWWDMGDGKTVRCPDCLRFRKKKIEWPSPKNPPQNQLEDLRIGAGPSSSTRPSKKKKQSRRQPKGTGDQ